MTLLVRISNTFPYSRSLLGSAGLPDRSIVMCSVRLKSLVTPCFGQNLVSGGMLLISIQERQEVRTL